MGSDGKRPKKFHIHGALPVRLFGMLMVLLMCCCTALLFATFASEKVESHQLQIQVVRQGGVSLFNEGTALRACARDHFLCAVQQCSILFREYQVANAVTSVAFQRRSKGDSFGISQDSTPLAKAAVQARQQDQSSIVQ